MEKETAKETVSKNFIEQMIEKDLAEGKYEEICTRFPPEPNGYLHIGHAKSILLNYGLAQKYHGKFNMRFDDTNPTKEKVEFVESIKEDIKWLGADWEDRLYFASDYFEQMYEAAVKLIKKGKAFKNIFYVVHRTAYNDAVFFYSGVLRHNGLRINGGHTKECADPHPENCTRSSGSNGRSCAGNVSRTYLRCNGCRQSLKGTETVFTAFPMKRKAAEHFLHSRAELPYLNKFQTEGINNSGSKKQD